MAQIQVRSTPLLLAAVLAVSSAHAQTITSVQQHFDALLRTADSGQTTRPEDLDQAIKAAPPADLSASLPLIFEALESRKRDAPLEGSMALIGIGMRPDSAELLKPFLGKLFDDLAGDYAGLSLLVLDGLRPAPPPEVTPRVLGFLARTDRDTRVQTGAVGLVLKHSPSDQQALTAVEHFASRPLDQESRTRLLDVITLLFKGNERLLPTITASISDPTPGVRSRAIYDLARLGRDVLGKYAGDLQRIAVDPNETQEVRASAERALGIWAGKDPYQQ